MCIGSKGDGGTVCTHEYVQFVLCVCCLCLRVTWHIVGLSYVLPCPCSVCMLVCMHALFCSNMGIVYVYTYAYMCILTCANAHVYTHINTDTQTQTQTHTQTHARISTHALTHTHSLSLSLSLSRTHTMCDSAVGVPLQAGCKWHQRSFAPLHFSLTHRQRHTHTQTHIYTSNTHSRFVQSECHWGRSTSGIKSPSRPGTPRCLQVYVHLSYLFGYIYIYTFNHV